MKKSILSIFFILSVHLVIAQQDQSPMVKLANKMADRMRDTLGLDTGQREKIFNINLSLAMEKSIAYSNHKKEDIGKELQKIENKRDGLYKKELSNQQYDIYKQKKRRIINNN